VGVSAVSGCRAAVGIQSTRGLIAPQETSDEVVASMSRTGKSRPPPRKGKGPSQVWVSLGVAALTAAATITAAAVSGGDHAGTVAPQPPGCVVVQGSVKVP
jgi:hypothetical protein